MNTNNILMWNELVKEAEQTKNKEDLTLAHKMSMAFHPLHTYSSKRGVSYWYTSGHFEKNIEHLIHYCRIGIQSEIVGMDKVLFFLQHTKIQIEFLEMIAETECSTCGGKGMLKYEEDVECDECYGSGFIECDDELYSNELNKLNAPYEELTNASIENTYAELIALHIENKEVFLKKTQLKNMFKPN
jgi:hypothetical protein